jgi:tricorn protease
VPPTDTLNSGYLRSPSISGDKVVFLTEDDIWVVGRTGGVARRLTSNLGPIGRTIVSPDGAFIAYTGTEEANSEVYVMPADGGPSHRRTYLGGNTQVRGWTPDARVIFMSDAGRANRADYLLYTLDPDEGIPELVNVGPAMELSYAADGKRMVIGRHTIDPARWKRYRGGTRGDLWVDREGKGNFRRLLNLNTNLASPLWVGERIYFLSDHEGIGNLYSSTPSGGGIRRHTDHEEYYARWAQTDGNRIVYMNAADIWIYDPPTDTSERIDVDLRSPRVALNRRFVDAARYAHSWNVHNDGHAITVNARGKLFTMPLWEQAPRQYGQRDGVRYRLSRWTADGKSLVCISDEGGEEALEVYSTDNGSRKKRLAKVDVGRAIELVTSPTSDEVVIANHRSELVWVNLTNNRSKILDRSRHLRIQGPVWSPDGRFVAYACAETDRTISIKLCEVATGTTTFVTRPEFYDLAPSFDPEGRYLYFLSYRVFDPVYDMLFFELGFPRAVRPHLVTLKADELSPFVPKPRGFGEAAARKKAKEEEAAKAAEAKRAQTKEGAKPKPKPIVIDLEGITDRVVAFPMPEGRYAQISGIRGKVLFTSFPIEGSLHSDFLDQTEEPRGKLEAYDLNELKLDTLINGINTFKVSADGSTMVYSTGGRLRAVRAGEKPANGPEAAAEGGASRRTGWIDLSRMRVSVEPRSEFRQMFREAWRFQKEHFWVADMSGVDWQRIHDRYRPLVDKVASRLEFSDLMWEMLGELGTSHAYEMGGDIKPPPPYRVGLLGADIVLRNGRWVIEHIVQGDSWDPSQNSPLNAPGVNVKEGDAIVAVNGQPTDPSTAPARLLVNQAGVDVELVVTDGRGRNRRTVYVKTLPDDTAARYREWVETNRRLVHDRTNGRVGYVHIPDMGPHGYSEFHRYYFSEVAHDGLIVDVRFNGGGHVSSKLLEKLARERVGYAVTRWGEPEPYWEDSPAGPLVCITNELAGSDGDIFSHVFKLKKLGPVVGKRTWGGVVGINVRHILVDNGMTTQPEYSFWFKDVGWGVENYGTDPTHDVDITPQDHAKGRDPQMDTGLRLMAQALRSFKPLRPDMKNRPHLALPVLPPRGHLPKATKATKATRNAAPRGKPAVAKRSPVKAKRPRRKR